MPRANLTYRVVPARSPEAQDARLGATAEERLRMVAELSRMAWIESGRPFPQYTRATMPIRLLIRQRDSGPSRG